MKAGTAKALRRLLLAGASVVVTLGVGEVAVRTLGIGPEFHPVARANFRLSTDPILGYELLPGSPDFGQRISSAGLRDREYAQAKPADTFRIAVVGDSVAYGLGVPRDQNAAEQLERMLNAHVRGATRFEVLNFAVTGYNVTQVAESVRTKVVAWQPDLLIYPYCLNDAQSYSTEMQRLLASLPADEGHYLAARQSTGDLLAHSRLFLLGKYAFTRFRARGAQAGNEDWRADPQVRAFDARDHVGYFTRLHESAEGARRLRQGVEEIRRALDVPVVVVLSPVLIDLDRYELMPLHASLRGTFERAGFRVLDLLEPYRAFARQAPYALAFDGLHPKAEAQLYAAAILARWLLRESLVPGPSKGAADAILEDRGLAASGLAPLVREQSPAR